MTLNEFNNLLKEEAKAQLASCCGAEKWQQEMINNIPYTDEVSLLKNAQHTWYNVCTEQDWQEAFTHHPKIGDVQSLSEKFASTMHLAGNEQQSVNNANAKTIQQLAAANKEYEAKFGLIFIVCATGKSAEEMLRLLNDRLTNSTQEELNIAMGEQAKITFLRLKKTLNDADWSGIKPSQLTTHVLDTSIGKPGKDITIRMKRFDEGLWQTLAQGVTNDDGRIADLLPQGKILHSGNYKLVFETRSYFEMQKIKGFYPEVEIQFTVNDDNHYHVPLLINPFGYSTYRGS